MNQIRPKINQLYLIFVNINLYGNKFNSFKIKECNYNLFITINLSIITMGLVIIYIFDIDKVNKRLEIIIYDV